MSVADTLVRPSVLVFAGLDPSGGAGIAADVQAIAAQGAHALTVATALTVQDNHRVYGVQPVDSSMVLRQAQVLTDRLVISAIKIGIPGSAANAQAIAEVIKRLRRHQPELPVVLDPVLASGHGDLLSCDDAVAALAPLLPLVTVITPNGVEARTLAESMQSGAQSPMQPAVQAQILRALGCRHVLITGGHDGGDEVVNRWYGHGAGAWPEDDGAAVAADHRAWHWLRLDGEFHGSGCTLASAIAAQLALGLPTACALELAQQYCYVALRDAYAVGIGQRIPLR